MKKESEQKVVRAVSLVVSLLTVMMTTTVWGAKEKQQFKEDELLVQFTAGVDKETARHIIHGYGGQENDEIAPLRIKRIKVHPQRWGVMLEALARNPHVKFAEPDYLASGSGAPNDTSYPSQWHLPKMSAPSGWDLSTGSPTIDIAIIDSGVDSTHPDLMGKVLPGYSFLTNTTDTSDVLGHGTAVAGTAAAIGNNGKGVAGLAWKNPIVPLVVLNASNSASYSNIARAITYAADHGIRVINISIGGSSSSSTLQSAVDYAWSKGCIIFACAMNNGTSTPYYPAACNHVVAVAATTSSDARASYSNYGNWITISAPGSGIYTTNRGGGYGSWSGTSFASPITAGLAALVLSLNPMLTNQQVVDLITQNADDLGTAGFDHYFGNGRINVRETLAAIQGVVPMSDNTIPTATITAPSSGKTVSGTVQVNVSAFDSFGIGKVALYINGYLFATDLTPAYSFAWDSTKVPLGIYQLEARAYDNAGNVGSSGLVSVNVVPDATPPTISISAPANGTSLSGLATTTIKATVSDNGVIKKTELYVDGTLTTTISSGSLRYALDLSTLASGSHQVLINSYDASGNVGQQSSTFTN